MSQQHPFHTSPNVPNTVVGQQQQQQFYNPNQYGSQPYQQQPPHNTVGGGGFYQPHLQPQWNMNTQQQVVGSSSTPPISSSSNTGGFFNPILAQQNKSTTSLAPPPTSFAFDQLQSSQQQQQHSSLSNNTTTPPVSSSSSSPSLQQGSLTSSMVDPMNRLGSISPTNFNSAMTSISSSPPPMISSVGDGQKVTTPTTMTATTSTTTTPARTNEKIDPRQMPSPVRLPFPEVNVKQEYQTASFLEHYMLPTTGGGSNPTPNTPTAFGGTSTPLLGNFALSNPQQQQQNSFGLYSQSSNLPSTFPFNATAIQQQPNTTNITPYFNVPPPPADRRTRIVCKGACSPNRIRPSLYCIPNTKKLLDSSQLMMGAMVQPMASFDIHDQPNFTPCVDFSNFEILRCSRCRVYINPFVKFIENGKKYHCNFCGFTNTTPDWYYCPTDVYGVRTDVYQRPELSIGDVDFVATKQFFDNGREPQPMTFVYVIDVGHDSVEGGVLKSVVDALKSSLLIHGPKYRNCKITFITYAKNIHFYNFKKSNFNNGEEGLKQNHPQVMIMADLQQSFVPIHQESMITIGDLIYKNYNPNTATTDQVSDETHLNQFFDRFYELASHLGDNSAENTCGSAMKCAEELLSESGGRVLLFTSKVPTLGQGNFTLPPNASTAEQERRNPFKLYGTDREKEIFIPELGFWKNLGISCAKKQIGIDIFLFSKMFIETTNLASASQTTGGHVYLYHHFNQKRDYERVLLDMNRFFERESGYDAVLKVRTSSGIGIRRYFGHFFQQTEDSLDLAVIDSDTAFGVEFKHDESNLLNASESGNHYIQSALVYTSSHDGKRYLRVQTCKLKTSTDYNTLFRRSDVGACLALFSRLFVHQVVQNRDTLDTVRDMITDRLINILACYRKNCSTNQGAGQLILPETLKYLPLYFLGLAKSPAFCRYTRVALDKKIHAFHLLMKFSSAQVMLFCFPRLYELHHLDFSDEISASRASEEGSTEESDHIIPITTDFDGSRYPFPPMISPCSSAISSNGIYLLYDGNECMFWIGRNAPQDKIVDLFGVSRLEDISLSTTKPLISLLNRKDDPEDDQLTIPNAPFIHKVKFILKESILKGVQHGGIFVYKEGSEGTDGSFFIRMVEDKFGSGMSSSPIDKSYTDYLCILHREVLKLV
ncbi:hypothetical protein C9374_013367 [Naegleria lovaniensis]|uniref:Uncharacterized protein n=1 Tax=Naegleria lovaniensis TaxID=51637 RepID=A0AA88KQ30_NAELO|nr:uncharacterized protein C9374_013367 [Naegleria lovaniensis]KAG2391882.1 hypothetical protein C9374_013367 [Naegleria lovaniensis]